MVEDGSKRGNRQLSVSILVELAASSKHQLQGKIIRTLRISKDMTQQQLADSLGVSRGAIIDIEKKGASDGVQLFAIADILEVDVDIFNPK
jgi:DNA-binding XRE family transcriptional regulator